MNDKCRHNHNTICMFCDPQRHHAKATVPEFIQPLTKREQFAMAAMQGMLACGASSYRDGTKGFVRSVTVKSTEYADALLKALEATNA